LDWLSEVMEPDYTRTYSGHSDTFKTPIDL